jgi:SAM-dependent methyltransferase
MTVKRDFERIYREQADPWDIGDASSDRYDRYVELIRPHAAGTMLDIGCGYGAFLARFSERASRLDGVEVSATAVARGRERFPFIHFHQGSAADLDAVEDLRGREFDLIVCSDMIYYLEEARQLALLAWINRHLTRRGRAFIAAWCPGGKYLKPEEFVERVERSTALESVERFASGHVALICRRTRTLIALTVDYETWHPIPEGKKIDWEADVFEPTEKLVASLAAAAAPATFFVELGEYFWLKENQPEVADRMEAQWRKLVAGGHDVQPHLHPCWLPELGASHKDGEWWWDWSKAKAHDYPGDLRALIGRCKEALEETLGDFPGYRVTTFRAGGYQAQPFERLSDALVANGLIADSSVYAGGVNHERGFDYSAAYSQSDPYFADPLDPQLRAIPAEQSLVELPIFAPRPGTRWSFDGDGSAGLAAQLLRYHEKRVRIASAARERTFTRVRQLVGLGLEVLGRGSKGVLKALPKSVSYKLIAHQYRRSRRHHFYVAIGHTKADLRFADLEQNVRMIADRLDPEFVTISQMADVAREDLAHLPRSASEELDYQVERETAAILSDQRNEAQSFHLQEMIPLDVDELLDFGCGAGYWSGRIGELYPWMKVTGIDGGRAFIEKANARYAAPNVSFVLADFLALPFADERFGCVYADNTIEHSFDVQGALAETFRVLRPGGALVGAIPLDALNPEWDCDNHTWKTTRRHALERLERAGYVDIFVDEVDTMRRFGQSPYPPSRDKMLYFRAWKPAGTDGKLARARRAMAWLYQRLTPGTGNADLDPARIIADGHALCVGYAIALLAILQRENYDARLATMEAVGHPRGRGPQLTDSHQVVETIIDGKSYVFDPMANAVFPHPLDALLRHPALALADGEHDTRYEERGYALYASPFWYERVVRHALRRNARLPVMKWTRRKHPAKESAK